MIIRTLAFLLALAATATASEFKRIPQTDGADDIILMTGHIERGDYYKFITVADGVEDAIVVLRSGGGDANEAMNIGRFIRLQGYETRVGGQCSSGCFLIWIAGKYRSLGATARLGLHSAGGTVLTISPYAWPPLPQSRRNEKVNKEIGIYLKSMGAPQSVIDLWPLADPTELAVITYSQARDWGLIHERPPVTRLWQLMVTPPPSTFSE